MIVPGAGVEPGVNLRLGVVEVVVRVSQWRVHAGVIVGGRGGPDVGRREGIAPTGGVAGLVRRWRVGGRLAVDVRPGDLLAVRSVVIVPGGGVEEGVDFSFGKVPIIVRVRRRCKSRSMVAVKEISV